VEAVREDEHSRAETLHEFPGLVEFENDGQIRTGATISAASLGNPNGFAVGIDVNGTGRTPGSAFRHLRPAFDGLIWIGKIIGGLRVALGIRTAGRHCEQCDDGYSKYESQST
jgi:hypothetical protein